MVEGREAADRVKAGEIVEGKGWDLGKGEVGEVGEAVGMVSLVGVVEEGMEVSEEWEGAPVDEGAEIAGMVDAMMV